MFFGAGGFNLFCRRTVMTLDSTLFLLLRFLPENVFVFCISLREVVEAEALMGFQFPAAFVITLDEKIDALFDFGGRAFAAAAEILVVLDFELTDVLLDLA